MGFGEAIMDVVGLLTTYQGRINRAKYWIAALIYFIISGIAGAVGQALGDGPVAQGLTGIVGLLTFISGILVGIKRLHDRDRPGWWMLVFYVVPSILIAAAVVWGLYSYTTYGTLGGPFFLFIIAAFALGIWAFIELGCLRGTVGPNRFGPDPLEGKV
jgi:uncharacterized membrane protein YhaH (DUF805 family)